MSIRGERFELSLSDDEGAGATREQPPPINLFDFVLDVQERASSVAEPPKPPAPRASQSGFPAHRKRATQSRFKKSRDTDPATTLYDGFGGQLGKSPPNVQSATSAPGTCDAENFLDTERRRIDVENREKIAAMSPEEIEDERRELLQGLNPSQIARLLQRATFEPGDSNADFPGLAEKLQEPVSTISTSRKKVTFAEPEEGSGSATWPAPTRHFDKPLLRGNGSLRNEHGDNEDVGDESDRIPEAVTSDTIPADSTIHFPHAPQPPQLDPSSATFLTDLHEKYFPSLPADPSKLEWMTSSTSENPYSTSQAGLDPKDIRFSFDGTLIPPSLAAEIPVTAGLHHHGNAPDAAGYTIGELAMLARSTVASQRCVAFQSLGRVLYRLGSGEFGNPSDGGAGTVGAEDTLGELARGLWGEIEKEGVVEICVAESDGRGVGGGRHLSAKAYATEAVWHWRKGGGRRWKAA